MGVRKAHELLSTANTAQSTSRRRTRTALKAATAPTRESLPRKAKEKPAAPAKAATPQPAPQPATRARRSAKTPGVSKGRRRGSKEGSNKGGKKASMPAARPKPAPESKTPCSFCMIDKVASDHPSIDDLPPACRECLTTAYHVCLDCLKATCTSQAAAGAYAGVYCVWCDALWDLQYIRKFVDPDTFDRYEKRLSYGLLEGDTSFRWCVQDQCLSGEMYDTTRTSEDPKICCSSCEAVNCFKCREPWHEGLSCEDHQRGKKSITETLKVMRSNHTKRCPQCATGVEKIHGCRYVHCACGHTFNWDVAEEI